MDFQDDELDRFAEHGAEPLPPLQGGLIEREGARIWYATVGRGPAVVLLHGGLGNSGNWGYQVPALTTAGYRVVLVDTRGHGRSTRDGRPYSYELLADDLLAVLDDLGLAAVSLVGWSDGACTSLILADKHPERVGRVFFFGCNMDPSGAKKLTEFPPALQHCFLRHSRDYAELSATPDTFEAFVEDVGLMQRTQPDYSAADLARIRVPVTVIHSEHDEFIKREHAEYLARSLPNARLVDLPGVSHFAPLQRPAQFNKVVLDFLA